jgi:hypothetical protein
MADSRTHHPVVTDPGPGPLGMPPDWGGVREPSQTERAAPPVDTDVSRPRRPRHIRGTLPSAAQEGHSEHPQDVALPPNPAVYENLDPPPTRKGLAAARMTENFRKTGLGQAHPNRLSLHLP